MSSDEAAIGLGFLDMALRQNHVRRITERLRLTEHLAPACTAEIEISLNLLNQVQRNACEAFELARQRSVVGSSGRQLLRPDTDSATASTDGERGQENIIWTPVARLPRQAVAPIDVRDSTGARLPRLTQLEVAMPLASGLYQLLRGMLGSIPDAQSTKPLGKFLHRVDSSRWLLQSALQALFISRSGPSEFARAPSTPGTRHGDAQRYRKFLADVLETYDDVLDPFYNLLDVALNDYLLIVGLSQPREHHLLTYEMLFLPRRLSIRGSALRRFGRKCADDTSLSTEPTCRRVCGPTIWSRKPIRLSRSTVCTLPPMRTPGRANQSPMISSSWLDSFRRNSAPRVNKRWERSSSSSCGL